MSKVASIIKYICKTYPHSHELSKARLTKMIYLADWESARKRGCQITDISWYFNNYGPYVDDVVDEAVRDPEINVITTTTVYGTPKIQVQYNGNIAGLDIGGEERAIIDEVIEETKTMYWNSFIKHVYDTYPIRENPRYSYLDLVDLAAQEKA